MSPVITNAQSAVADICKNIYIYIYIYVYTSGESWRSESLEKDWEVRWGCALGCIQAAGLAKQVVLYATEN